MRNSFRGAPLINKEGKFAAWNLGADHCAEHEWGIKNLQALLGISADEKVFGIDRRRVTRVPEEYVYFKLGRTRATLVIGDEVRYVRKWGTPEEVQKKLDELTDRFKPWRKYTDYKTKQFTVEPTTAWDDGAFIISVEGKEAVQQLQELHDALVSGDGAVWLGGGGVFENAGLVVGIVSRFDKENLDLMFNVDKERYEVKQYVKKIGIEEKLTKAGKRWYALSPGDKLKSRVGDLPIETKYDIMFWLNPQEQQKYNYGWFTVEELEQWAEDKGPVINTGERKVKHRNPLKRAYQLFKQHLTPKEKVPTTLMTITSISDALAEDLLRMDDRSLMWFMSRMPVAYCAAVLSDRRVCRRASMIVKKNPGAVKRLEDLRDQFQAVEIVDSQGE